MAQQSLREQIANDQKRFANFTVCEQIYTVREIHVATWAPINITLQTEGEKNSGKKAA
jgi:hypothetical protein